MNLKLGNEQTMLTAKTLCCSRTSVRTSTSCLKFETENGWTSTQSQHQNSSNQTMSKRSSSATRYFPTHNSTVSFILFHFFICLASVIYQPVWSNRLSSTLRHTRKYQIRILYQNGRTSEAQVPECEPWAVCNKVDTYSTAWIERQCRCSTGQTCSTSLDSDDGHTISDKARQFKICEPVSKLPTCKYFKEVTWTLTTHQDNTTSQQVNCICPKNSVAYIFKHEVYEDENGYGYKYMFACSPESRLRCQRKEPCRLFTVKKRPNVEEVNTNTLCHCPRNYKCPTHHDDPNVIRGTFYPLDHIKTYSGYCAPDHKYQANSAYKSLQSLFN